MILKNVTYTLHFGFLKLEAVIKFLFKHKTERSLEKWLQAEMKYFCNILSQQEGKLAA